MARIELGLSLAEFEHITPRFFEMLLKRRRSVQQHQDYMLAQVVAAVKNHGFRHMKEWQYPGTFVPGWEQPKPKRKRESVDVVGRSWETFFERLARQRDRQKRREHGNHGSEGDGV